MLLTVICQNQTNWLPTSSAKTWYELKFWPK